MMKTMTNELNTAVSCLRRYLPEGGRVLCALSGGLDSMCLLHFLSQQPDVTVTAAHFHHGLRETAHRDQAFVQHWCQEHHIPLICGNGDTRSLAEQEGLSVEEAARRLRYAFLEETAQTVGCDWIATAHHADDNAETMLLNLIRGTGLKGLCGIPPVRNSIIRPFLDVTQATLKQYAAVHHLPHVEDETNQDPNVAARNRLRLQVMPLLRELNPQAVAHMTRTAGILRELDEELTQTVQQHLQQATVSANSVSMERKKLRTLSETVRPRVLLSLFEKLGVGAKDIRTAHLTSLTELLEKPGREWNLPHGVTARVTETQLILEINTTAPEPMELILNRPVRWGAYTLCLRDNATGDGLAIRSGTEPLHVMPCPPSARLTLPGTRGGRSIKRLCTDYGISPTERNGLPAIYAENRLAAVWRLGTTLEFLPETKEFRFIEIMKEAEEKKV